MQNAAAMSRSAPTEAQPVRPMRKLRRYSTTWARASHERGIRIITTADQRWRRCDVKSVNLLPNALAKKKAQRASADEVLLIEEPYFERGIALYCNVEKTVAEGAGAASRESPAWGGVPAMHVYMVAPTE